MQPIKALKAPISKIQHELLGFKVSSYRNFKNISDKDTKSYTRICPKNKTKVTLNKDLAYRCRYKEIKRADGFIFTNHGNKITRNQKMDGCISSVNERIYQPSKLRELMLKIPEDIRKKFHLKVPKAKWVKPDRR